MKWRRFFFETEDDGLSRMRGEEELESVQKYGEGRLLGERTMINYASFINRPSFYNLRATHSKADRRLLGVEHPENVHHPTAVALSGY